MMRCLGKVGAKVGVIAALLVVVLLTVACGGGTTTTTVASNVTTTAPTGSTDGASSTDTSLKGEPIKIGVLASLTGVAAGATGSIMNALQLEVDTTNAAGGIKGRQIELVTMDDKSDSAVAVADMTKLITQDKVTAVLGPLTTPAAAAVAPLAEKYEVPLLRWDTPTLNDPTTKPVWSFYISDGPKDVADALLKQIKAAGWKNILAIGDQLPVNQDTLTLLKTEAASAGAKITVMSDTWSLGATDLTPIINKIVGQYKNVKPDVVFVLAATTQTPVLVKGLKALGVTVPIQGGPASAHPSIFTLGPEVMEGFLVVGAGVTNPTQLPDDYPGKDVMLDFATRYKAKFGEGATLFAAAGYDSFHILLEGLKVGGDDKAIVRETIENLTGFVGAQGVFNFTAEDHQGHKGGYCDWLVKSGEFTFVRVLN